MEHRTGRSSAVQLQQKTSFPVPIRSSLQLTRMNVVVDRLEICGNLKTLKAGLRFYVHLRLHLVEIRSFMLLHNFQRVQLVQHLIQFFLLADDFLLEVVERCELVVALFTHSMGQQRRRLKLEAGNWRSENYFQLISFSPRHWTRNEIVFQWFCWSPTTCLHPLSIRSNTDICRCTLRAPKPSQLHIHID